MGRPKGLTPRSVKRIFAVLVGGPKCFDDIWKETGLHRNTVGFTLEGLEKKDMIVRYRIGHERWAEIKKTQPLYYGWEIYGWEIPWIGLMMTKDDWERKWERVDEEIARGEGAKAKNAEREFWNWIDQVLIEPNEKLAKVLEEINMTNISLRYFRDNLETPYCLECLRNTRKFIKAKYSKETGEFCCPECGLVVEREYFDKRPPIIKPEKYPRRKLSRKREVIT